MCLLVCVSGIWIVLIMVLCGYVLVVGRLRVLNVCCFLL